MEEQEGNIIRKGECTALCEYKEDARKFQSQAEDFKETIREQEKELDILRKRIENAVQKKDKLEILRGLETNKALKQKDKIVNEYREEIEKQKREIDKLVIRLEKTRKETDELTHEYLVNDQLQKKIKTLKRIEAKEKKLYLDVVKLEAQKLKITKAFNELCDKANKKIEQIKRLKKDIQVVKIEKRKKGLRGLFGGFKKKRVRINEQTTHPVPLE